MEPPLKIYTPPSAPHPHLLGRAQLWDGHKQLAWSFHFIHFFIHSFKYSLTPSVCRHCPWHRTQFNEGERKQNSLCWGTHITGRSGEESWRERDVHCRMSGGQRAALPERPRCLLSELGSCMLLGAWQGTGMRSSQGQDQVSKGPWAV